MSGTLAIIDYGSGNLRSAEKAFARAALESGCDCTIRVTDDPALVAKADRIVLPGVGAFADCKRGLDAVPGMRDALTQAVIEQKRPFLGICVGMQLMATRGLEHGETQGLGWIAGEVVALTPDTRHKVPHMGWNELALTAKPHPLLAGVPQAAHAYFVHSYHFRAERANDVAASTDYGIPIAAMVARGNLAGVQFHPEKSQETGLRLLANFLAWRP
jgi:imidazole glycerol-phosphate synthase subunit HisH